ncbi:hypothetical protein LSH36_356g05009 [Paralvinella palmiformis]|uniref:HDAg domain-containing protein n=1 Tax=Paralvinella palmiformis TaxID=53620 RepID=A0AAD9JEF7_9ANNE|nr:hypothetical protein LSH36_356g05009 [Paralvinella palmiformis]
MAVREGDVALWLHNKLGSTDDLWSGGSICSQLTRDKLLLIQDCFHNLQPHVKVKLLLSFLHIPKRNVEEWKEELEELIQTAADDTDQWVTMVAEILKSYPSTGTLNSEIDENQTCFQDVINDLKKLVRRSHDSQMAPLECSYLSRNAQLSITGQVPQPVKHFALKRKSKSAALRAELLQKSSEAANMKKNKPPGTSLPLKIRSFAKKMDDSSPMRGIPNPQTGGFMRPSSLGTRFGGSTSNQRPSANRREGGIKLLDIKEQPVGTKEAKRRKKQAEQEALEQQKKEKEVQSTTPDYAAGLVNSAALAGVEITGGANYMPPVVTRITSSTPTTVAGQVTTPTNTANNTEQKKLEPTGGVETNQTQSQNQARKGLSLTREQMFAAQEMFRTSNKVTRPEKALILGFMAGSRDNPCRQQGDIVNIRLHEEIESIQQPDGMFKPMAVDTFIQMNYGTGEWKRIKKYREVQAELE